MKHGFSLIEILIAIAILTSAIVAASVTIHQLPFVVQDAYGDLEEVRSADERMSETEILARSKYAEAIQGRSVVSQKFADGAAGLMQGTLRSLITDPGIAADEPCQPFLSGDWQHPHVAGSYELIPGALLPGAVPAGLYPVSSLAIAGDTLAIGIANTTRTPDPNVFFFRLSETNGAPAYAGSFDAATSSKNGVPALASGNGYVYAANGFSGVSTTTCIGNPGACAQLQVIDPHSVPPQRISFLQIPTALPAHAVLASGATAPGNAISYHAGYAYLGLGKTAQGQELQIIDVRDPLHPHRVAGAQIGRGVNAIAVNEQDAYVGTDDNDATGKAVIAFDISDTANPLVESSYRFPGAGFVRALAVSGTHLFSGRTFAAGNSEEFTLLDRSATTSLSRVGGSDIGTAALRQGAYALLIRDFMAFILADHQLISMNVINPSALAAYAALPLPHGTATSMACRENTLYIGSVDTDGNGYLSVVTSS
ncbi:MAG TPA: prepilin-type N-terminal cleavage/methylation domain-containing protein [Candidatus Paceibacterota bacterium]|nr:prepilin-type N-terminal cleavage/methylation domain-containing protein [Candidatus Paceibacterota bacterium]